MNSIQNQPNSEQQTAVVLQQPKSTEIRPPEKKPLTFGQKVADKMASKVGSWAFLIGQSTILAGWVGFNLMPGVPHWDESPFILLNLVFSFASAYTAPVVLMSQNRQSEEDRESANHNYQITLQAAQNLELLHEKLDAEYGKKLEELTNLIKQQQTKDAVQVVFVPSQALQYFDGQSPSIAQPAVFNNPPKNTVLVKVEPDPSRPSSLNLEQVQVVVSK